jgi:sulfonate dioxygenase
MTTIAQVATGLESATATLHLHGSDAEPKRSIGAPGPDYKYAKFLPSWDPGYKLAPLVPFKHVDPGHAALNDPNPRSFLDSAHVNDLTPKFGTEVSGIQLHELDEHAKAQLALYVAQRGVVVFRDQDFVDQPPEWQLRSWGETFGRLHIHPVSGQPKDIPEFHLVYKDAVPGSGFFNYKSDSITTTGFHSDVTYEEQPPGLTTLFLYETPTSGGDTLYVSQVEAYNRLSDSFKAYLETLSVVHSGVEQANFSRRGGRGGVVKREPVENVHPLVRRHPVTGQKALFVNKQFSRKIVGLKDEESEALLNFL